MTGAWTIEPFDAEAAASLSRELELSEITASVLVRRGYGEPESARRFLDAELPGHDPFLLGDMAAAVERIRAAIAEGKRICVHGDYDVDGICATALAVLILRELGADVVWHLPSRFEEGYGVSRDTLGKLADDGIGLVLTVDCGITAVAEVAEAKALGLEVVVTDHHRPGETLPDCPIVATRPSSYPFPELCGTGVVHKLGEALLGPDHPALQKHLDLVALATIADVVPLVDENRGLASAGLRALACTRRPGLQALMRSAHVDPAAVDAGAVGFRLAPRINAAGRLCRPDIALELILTEDARGGEEARRGARGAEPRPAGGRGPDPARGDRSGRGDARARAPPPRLRPRARGLARGRDRHRRLAARRALPPSRRPHRRVAGRLEGLRALGLALRPPRRARAPARSTWSGSAATAPRPGSRSTRLGSRPSRRRSGRTPTPLSPTRTCTR